VYLEDGRPGGGRSTLKVKEQYDMKHLKIAFGLVVVAGLMAVVASPAMAAGPIWVTCVNVGANNGKWVDPQCTKAGVGEWETRAVTETVEVTSSSTGLLLTDKSTKAGASSVECGGTNVGTIGAKGSDSVISIHAENCKKVKEAACKTLMHVEARNLPWSSLLVERENANKELEVRNRLTSLIAGQNPGWAVECNTLLGVKVDVCTGITTTGVRDNRALGRVEGLFDPTGEKEPASCTEGNKESGTVSGTVVNSLRNARGELQSFWLLAEALKT